MLKKAGKSAKYINTKLTAEEINVDEVNKEINDSFIP